MRGLLLVGLSHKTAPLEVRERLAIPAGELESAVRTMRELHTITEAMLVATCNRVEAYVVSRDPSGAARQVREHLEGRARAPLAEFLYEHQGKGAVRHLFHVAASLDSMVIGEPQILGQVKDAYAAAERAGALGAVLGRCVPRAFGIAKRVRSQTGIAQGAVSVSSIAADLATKVLGDLAGRRVLLVGAGKMGETSAKQLSKRGGKLTVVNRSYERAEELARGCGGEARAFGDLENHLQVADVVICSTASPKFIITHDLMASVVRARRYRPLFMIDIAVPRDIDPRVNDLDNVFLFDIDDLQKVVKQHLEERQKEATAAIRVVDEELEEFDAHVRSLELVPTIAALRARFLEVGTSELERTLPRLASLGPKEKKALEAMMGAFVSKLLHRPITELRSMAERPEGPELIAAVQRLFELRPAGEAAREEVTPAEPGEGEPAQDVDLQGASRS
ncbi:MAG: glutamyl-tRNA reductase [Deltaproteobacteria bacterium]|nr:glutamyl-tRNA reductase [Deltaproteobacteria bacterium]